MLLKSLPRVTIHLSQIAFKQYFSQEPELEGHEQSTFITDITEDQIYCGWWSNILLKNTAIDFTADIVQKFLHSFYTMLWVRSHMVRKKICGVHNNEDKPMVPSGRTSGTPSPCCLTGKPTGFHQVGILIKCYWMPSAIKWEKNSLPGESSATLKCSGSGKHGCTFKVNL